MVAIYILLYYYVVINESVVVFVGERVIVPEYVQLTVNCSPLIDQAISSGVLNPTVNWFIDGNELYNRSLPNIVISADRRLLIITDTLLFFGGRLGNDGNYTCDVCKDFTSPNCNETTPVVVCGEYQ